MLVSEFNMVRQIGNRLTKIFCFGKYKHTLMFTCGFPRKKDEIFERSL